MVYAVLGPPGTFSEEALRLYAGSDIKIRETEDISQLFALVDSGQVSDGFVPLENSSAGMISSALECLAASSLKIKGALEVPVRQYLLANGDYVPEEVELLISQPVALEQCRNFVTAQLKRSRKEITDSTARAAQMVQQEKRRAAAIGSQRSGRLYGLKTIAADIQDGFNYTRFIHIGKSDEIAARPHKSSLLLSLPDKAGALYELLGVFARNQLNLNKIESRPGRVPEEYVFYIEVEQGRNDLRMEMFLPELTPYCNWIKYLGSYTQKRISRVDGGLPQTGRDFCHGK